MNQTIRRIITGAILAALCLGVFTGCGANQTEAQTSEPTSAESVTSAPPTISPAESPAETTGANETRTVTDAGGNTVEVSANLSRIAVVPLPWSSVVYAIDGSSERLVSINPGAMSAYTGHFFSKIDSAYGELDTTSVGADLSINMEEIVNRAVESVVIWDYQTDEAAQLKELGITPVMVKNNTIEDLLVSFAAIGQMLGKEDRAQQFIDLYSEVYDYLQSYSDEVSVTDKPKVLYLRNPDLALQGNDMFIADALTLAGADNVAPDLTSITMEEILELDPDIILLSNFDTFTPDDLYNNTIYGQDWSAVSAVRNKRVYKTPMGIYRWDAPGVETPLMMKWLASLIQPEIFSEIDIEREVISYFEDFFDRSLTEEDIAQIFSKQANANSAA